MFKININLNKIFFYRSYLLIFCLIFLFNNTAYVKADSKIYLDLAEIQFENERNYKQHQTASQLNINIHLDEEIKSNPFRIITYAVPYISFLLSPPFSCFEPVALKFNVFSIASFRILLLLGGSKLL